MNRCIPVLLRRGAFSILLLLFFASTSNSFSLDLVEIGNPGNDPHIQGGRLPIGSVGHVYYIGKYEITAVQYTDFLNAVATDDPNGLYNEAMADSWQLLGANIQRSGSAPNYIYSVPADWAQRPVNYVSFWDAIRFTNWLHNGQPTGPQGPGTTENGAYHDVGNPLLFGRNLVARFFLPTNDEWYKAAYHDKSTVLPASYFEFPLGTESEPGNDPTETTNSGNNANYLTFKYSLGVPYWRSVVGQYYLSASPYGTFDQGGNVAEWTETNDPTARLPGHFAYGLWGGSFQDPYGLRATLGSSAYAENEYAFAGLRVAATVAEPSSVALCAAGSLIVFLRRRTWQRATSG